MTLILRSIEGLDKRMTNNELGIDNDDVELDDQEDDDDVNQMPPHRSTHIEQ